MKEMKKTSLQTTDGEQLNEGTFRSERTKKGDIMKNVRKASMQFFLALTLLAAPLVAFQLQGTEALAQSSYFSNRGCTSCHSTPVASTCAGCHEHSGNLTATKNKTTSYAPGETVTITLTSSGARSGWIGVRLYNQTGAEIARSTGNQSGKGGSAVYPAVLSASAPAAAGTYTWRIAYLGNEDGNGTGDVHSEISVNVPITVAAVVSVAPSKIGVFNNGTWYLDVNGTGAWDGSTTDRQPTFGFAGAAPLAGDWNGNGTIKIGVYDKGTWYLDLNNNGVWNGAVTDRQAIFGFAGAIPVTGDWNGNGTTKIGVYDKGTWYLDLNGNGVWDGATTDRLVTFGFAEAIPVTGDWNGNGTTKIGVYDKGTWYLDLNGNGVWNGAVTDRQVTFGYAGAIPVTGDWNADGKTDIGTFDNGSWYLDQNGSGTWDGETTDRQYFFGFPGATPVSGKW